MKDLLIFFGVLAAIGLFAYAVVHSARRQRDAKKHVFKDFAVDRGLRYREKDDGEALGFARGFDGVGRFASPSLGKTAPKDVVSGTVGEARAILFRHSVRYSEGWAREWFVAGLTRAAPMAKRCAIQFRRKGGDSRTMHLQDDPVKELKTGSLTIVVRAASRKDAGATVEDRVLEKLAGLARPLSFLPEIQIRGERIIAYPAGRNASVDDVETLAELFDFTRRAAGLCENRP